MEHQDYTLITCPNCGNDYKVYAVFDKDGHRLLNLVQSYHVECDPDCDDFLLRQEHDPVNHPSHYGTGGMECIDWIEKKLTHEEMHGYLKGNILKYLYRYEDKENPLQDLQKARWYLERLIKDVAMESEVTSNG